MNNGNKKKSYEVGDLVFAKVRGYPAWPARIAHLIGAKKYGVFFFGTYESGNVKREEIWEFNQDTKIKFGELKSSIKRKGFPQGMYEIQNTPYLTCSDESSAPIPQAEEDEAAMEEEEAEAAQEEEESASAQDCPTAEEAGSPPQQQAPGKEETEETKGGRKRKADDTPTAPPSKKKPLASPETPTPATPETPASATVSRSGRVVKQPKEFVDDDIENGTDNEGNKTSPPKTSKNTTKNEEPRKIWVEVKSTGDIIEINLDLDKPDHFESKEKELAWNKASARNALKFKERVESGEFIPDEVRIKLENKKDLTEHDAEILKKARQISLRMEKIRWLKIEQRVMDINISLKQSANLENPDMEKCVKSMEELDTMAVSPLMLKKQPDIITTVRKLRRYVGPVSSEKEFATKSEKVRGKAEQVYTKIKGMFNVPSGTVFQDAFDNIINEFKSATKTMTEEQILLLVSDPTKKSSKKIKI